jgi:hypothetical protein
MIRCDDENKVNSASSYRLVMTKELSPLMIMKLKYQGKLMIFESTVSIRPTVDSVGGGSSPTDVGKEVTVSGVTQATSPLSYSRYVLRVLCLYVVFE